MAQQTINIGSAPNDGTGDTIRVAYNKCNLNFTELYTAVALLAPLASPVFTGNPTAPTPTAGDNDTSVATTAFVTAADAAMLASPTFTGDPKAPTPTAGDNDTSIATTAFVTAADALGPLNCGRLDYVSATALSFKPYNGDRIKIAGVRYAIPSGGIAGVANTGIFKEGTAGQNLTASTLYYVYAFNNGGTITADFSTTGHSPDTTAGNVGTEIKTGNNSRTLIGMIYTNPSAQFQRSPTAQCVLSWFNRRDLVLEGPSTAGATSTSTSPVELAAGASRVYFLTWVDEAVRANLTGTAANSVVGANTVTNIYVDNTTPVASQTPSNQPYTSGAFVNQSWGASFNTTEALHWITPAATVSGGTGTYYVYINGSVRG